jgi:hypothetical protein
MCLKRFRFSQIIPLRVQEIIHITNFKDLNSKLLENNEIGERREEFKFE